MSSVTLLLAIVLSHVDGDTFWARVMLPLVMPEAQCRALFADQRNNPEVFPRIFVAPDCRVVAVTKVRLREVDTPETYRPRCEAERKRGKEASAATAKLLPVGSTVTLRTVTQDLYGDRIDSEVISADGVDIGAELIRRGLATKYGNKPWCKKPTTEERK